MLLQSFGFEAIFEGVFTHDEIQPDIFTLKQRPRVREISEKNKIFSGSGKSRGILKKIVRGILAI